MLYVAVREVQRNNASFQACLRFITNLISTFKHLSTTIQAILYYSLLKRLYSFLKRASMERMSGDEGVVAEAAGLKVNPSGGPLSKFWSKSCRFDCDAMDRFTGNGGAV